MLCEAGIIVTQSRLHSGAKWCLANCHRGYQTATHAIGNGLFWIDLHGELEKFLNIFHGVWHGIGRQDDSVWIGHRCKLFISHQVFSDG